MQPAERGIAEADQTQAVGLHMWIRRPIPSARKTRASRSAEQELVELQLPDKSHSWSSHAAQIHGEPRDFPQSNRHILTRHPSSDDGDSTLLKYHVNLMLRSTNRQLRYVATAHPLGGVTATESAATLEFESDTDACSQGQGGKKHNSEPDQYPVF